MISDSFKTVFKYPKMIIGFALPMLAILALYIPFFSSMINYDNFSGDDFMMPLMMMGFMLVFFLVMLAMQFLYIPILYNYIYEASLGEVKEGWAKRGLKRSWWKIFVTSIIAMIPFYIVYFIMIFPMIFLMMSDYNNVIGYTIGISIFFGIISLFWSALFIISLVTVVAEKDYGEGLKNIFRFGWKNYMKVVLMVLGIYAVSIVIGLAAAIPAAILEDTLTWNVAADRITIIALIIIGVAVFMALYAVVASFMLVYTNKLYIIRREELREKDALKLQSQVEQNAVE